jgi:hypothetical protein
MMKTQEIKSRSGATSLFDIQIWTFDACPPLEDSMISLLKVGPGSGPRGNVGKFGVGDNGYLTGKTPSLRVAATAWWRPLTSSLR